MLHTTDHCQTIPVVTFGTFISKTNQCLYSMGQNVFQKCTIPHMFLMVSWGSNPSYIPFSENPRGS